MSKKPLAILTTFNRLGLTQETLRSWEKVLHLINMVIVDNGSTDGTPDFLLEWMAGRDVEVQFLEYNLGCPRALNIALAQRQPGQAVLKIDNDVRLLSGPDEFMAVEQMLKHYEEKGINAGMVSAYYEPWPRKRVLSVMPDWQAQTLYTVQPVIGHCVYHTGALMDAAGHFDVLGGDHLYGFEDLILSHKARLLGLTNFAWQGWRIENIQRRSALGDRATVRAHTDSLRDAYEHRLALLNTGGSLYTNAAGQPRKAVN